MMISKISLELHQYKSMKPYICTVCKKEISSETQYIRGTLYRNNRYHNLLLHIDCHSKFEQELLDLLDSLGFN